MWGGRFTERPDAIMEEINVSIDVDRHLYAQDITASKAHAAMLAAPDVESRYDLSSLRCCVSAGEPLPGELYRRWRARFGSEVLDGIGSTEVLHIYISARAGQVEPGSSGTPVDGYRVRIVNDRGDELPPGEVGDLIVSGPSTALSYWNRAEQTRQKMRGEWFASGDK